MENCVSGVPCSRAKPSQAQSLADLQQQRILSAVRTQYYDALTIERRVEVLDRLAQLSSEAVGVTRQLFNVGAADRPDVLEAEIEAQRAQLDLTAARNTRFAVWRRLAATVADPTLTPRPLATSIDAAIPELDRETSLRDILNRSPEVRAARADIERNRAIVSRARKETFPDLFLRGGLAYNRELLESSVGGGPLRPVGREGSLEVGLSVPLFNRNQGAVAAARAEQSRAEVEVSRLELSIESRLASLFDDYLTALRSAEAYRIELLPRAEEAYQLYLAKYRDAAAAYPQVLIAQRTLFQLNAEYLAHLDVAWHSALRIQGFLVEDDGLAVPMRPGDIGPWTGTVRALLEECHGTLIVRGEGIMVRHFIVAAAVVAALTPGAVTIAQQAANPQLVAACVQSQQQAMAAVDAANRRIELARQTNQPAAMRAAMDDLQSVLSSMRTQLAPCAELQAAAAPAAHDMANMPGMANTSSSPAASPAPATTTDAHAGHVMPATPATPDPHAGHVAARSPGGGWARGARDTGRAGHGRRARGAQQTGGKTDGGR